VLAITTTPVPVGSKIILALSILVLIVVLLNVILPVVEAIPVKYAPLPVI